jgi:hypothetical protein
MANEAKNESKTEETPAKPAPKAAPAAPAPAPVAAQKYTFLEWFSVSLKKFHGLQPSHMAEIREYFKYLGISDPATLADFDAGMKKFGLLTVDEHKAKMAAKKAKKTPGGRS